MTVEEGMFLQKEYYEGYDLITGDTVISMKLSLSALQIQQGLIKELGYRNFSALLAIASFSNTDNVAFPTLEKLSEITGMTRPTLIKAIKELEQVKIGGERVIRKTKVLTAGGNTKSLYHFVQGTKDEIIPVKPADYIEMFCNFFKEEFGRAYSPNYGRDTKLIKDKLMAVFPEEDLPKIIEIAVKHYSKWSNNPQYPTPTIGALCSWLANKAADEVAAQKKTEQEVAERIAVAEKAEAHNPLEQLNLL